MASYTYKIKLFRGQQPFCKVALKSTMIESLPFKLCHNQKFFNFLCKASIMEFIFNKSGRFS